MTSIKEEGELGDGRLNSMVIIIVFGLAISAKLTFKLGLEATN